jgi:predicted nucleic acid-binding protein
MKTADTNVLIYALDQTDAAKHRAAIEILEQLKLATEPPVILWQVGCEFLAYLQRQRAAGRFSVHDVEQELNQILSVYSLALPDETIFYTAIKLKAKYSLSHWDSLLLAACISAGIDTLYSEDMSHGMTYDSVTVLNPFQNS